MVWVRIDDEFPEHPKIAQAGPLAMAVHVAALCYCNRKLTDGFVPRGIARTLLDWEIVDPRDGRVYEVAVNCGMSGQDIDPDWIIALLVEHGLWYEVVGGYQIHDFLDYQPSKQSVEGERETARQRMAERRAKSKGNDERSSREHQPNTERSSDPPEPGPEPEPTSRSKPPPGGDDADASSVDPAEQSFQQFWNDYPRHARNGKPGGGGSRKKALDRWRRMKAGERELALSAVDNYREWCERPDGEFPAHATTWLNEQRWEQWQEPAPDNVTSLNGQGDLPYNHPLREGGII